MARGWASETGRPFASEFQVNVKCEFLISVQHSQGAEEAGSQRRKKHKDAQRGRRQGDGNAQWAPIQNPLFLEEEEKMLFLGPVVQLLSLPCNEKRPSEPPPGCPLSRGIVCSLLCNQYCRSCQELRIVFNDRRKILAGNTTRMLPGNASSVFRLVVLHMRCGCGRAQRRGRVGCAIQKERFFSPCEQRREFLASCLEEETIWVLPLLWACGSSRRHSHFLNTGALNHF